MRARVPSAAPNQGLLSQQGLLVAQWVRSDHELYGMCVGGLRVDGTWHASGTRNTDTAGPRAVEYTQINYVDGTRRLPNSPLID
eukprot:6629821-Prymnesium_polylepis.1